MNIKYFFIALVTLNLQCGYHTNHLQKTSVYTTTKPKQPQRIPDWSARTRYQRISYILQNKPPTPGYKINIDTPNTNLALYLYQNGKLHQQPWPNIKELVKYWERTIFIPLCTSYAGKHEQIYTLIDQKLSPHIPELDRQILDRKKTIELAKYFELDQMASGSIVKLGRKDYTKPSRTSFAKSTNFNKYFDAINEEYKPLNNPNCASLFYQKILLDSSTRKKIKLDTLKTKGWEGVKINRTRIAQTYTLNHKISHFTHSLISGGARSFPTRFMLNKKDIASDVKAINKPPTSLKRKSSGSSINIPKNPPKKRNLSLIITITKQPFPKRLRRHKNTGECSAINNIHSLPANC